MTQIAAGTNGSAASGVTLTLSMSTGVFNALQAGASTSYNGFGPNSSLNNYFVFQLGSGTIAGRFQTLDLNISGVDFIGTIQYGGTGFGRFGSSPGITDTLGDVTVDGQEFALSYTGNYASCYYRVDVDGDSRAGTWGMILGGFGMLIGIQRLRRRRVGI